MTGNQKSAGYYDSVRNCPMYVGDVYYNKKEELPYYKIIDNIAMGISVHHNNTTEVTPIARFGANLVQMDFIGNIFENENVIEEHKASLETPQEPVMFANTPISDATENVSEEVEMVEETQQTEPIETAETTETKSEEISETTPEAIEEKIAAVEQANEELKESNEKLKENIATMFEAPSEEKDEEHEQICSTDSDVTATENGTSTDELQEDGTGNNSSTDSEEPATETADEKPTEEGAVSAEATTGKNVIVEVAKEAIPEVIANTKDEKNAIMRKKFLKNLISKNNSEIGDLQIKVEYNNNLASTLDFEPFVKLKHIVTEAIHSNVDDENIKGIKDRTKDFESIVNIQNLLKEYKQKALDAEQRIVDLEDEISKFEDELAELEAKIDTFARQEKLPLDSVTKNN